MNTRVFYNLLFWWASFTFLIMPVFVEAAAIYFSPASGNHEVGERFLVNVLVSSDGEEMNAVEAVISPGDANLQLVSVAQANSIIDFWAQEPQIDGNGNMRFGGVVLEDGYSGSSGKIATITLRARSQGDALLSVVSGSVLANDGQGTALPTGLRTARFIIGPSAEEEPPVVGAIPDGFSFSKDLRQGDSDKEVSYLQICLRDLGFYTGDITGYFNLETKQAVIDFQEKYFNDILVPWGFAEGTGLIGETTRSKLNQDCFVQLFDINLEIDNDSIVRAKDLLARVIFVSFGKVPTPVDLTFKILDENENEIYVSQDETVVETEAVFTQEFKYLDLPAGKYRLELTTLYNTDVEDKFYADFEVTGRERAIYPFVQSLVTEYWFWMVIAMFLAIIVIILLAVIIIILVRRMPEYCKKRNQRILKRERAVLRRAHERLLATREKTEKELQEIEDKLKKFSKRK